MEWKPENLYNCRTHNKHYQLMKCWQTSFGSPSPWDLDKIAYKCSPLLFSVMGKPRVNIKISALSLKAKFHRIILDSVLWIPIELVWVVGGLAISVCWLCVLFPQFPHTHRYTHTHACTLVTSIPCTPSLFPQRKPFSVSSRAKFFTCVST